jgi:alkanesulfonate monooxygenase SsuD/methylene tetrahydromethanopterin reductase-like flavin-dependent oxidoreductase (luciferase family)
MEREVSSREVRLHPEPGSVLGALPRRDVSRRNPRRRVARGRRVRWQHRAHGRCDGSRHPTQARPPSLRFRVAHAIDHGREHRSPRTAGPRAAGRFWQWARAAERRGFKSLAVIDRTASGLAPRGRAHRLEQQIAELRTVWRGEVRGYAGRIGPPPVAADGPPLLIAGHVPAALRRAARLGDGWIMGGGSPDEFTAMAAEVDAEWMAQQRTRRPRKAALAYFALGEHAGQAARAFTDRYYDFPPDPGDQVLIDAAGVRTLAEAIALRTPTTPDAVRSTVEAWSDAGCDELVLLPCAADADQVDLLADAVF